MVQAKTETKERARALRRAGRTYDEIVAELQKTSLKRHNPKTNRIVGDGYRGCLRVIVNGSADLYRRIEGWWYGIVVEANRQSERMSGLA